MRNTSLCLIFLLISGCRIENESLDQKAFSTFDKLCKEKSSEFVDKGTAYGPLTLFDMPSPSSPGPGKANRGVYDPEYDPDFLLKALMIGPDQLSQIRYVYQFYPRGSVIPKRHEACSGNYYIDITSLAFQKPGRTDCTRATKWDRETDTTRYVVSYSSP